MKKFKFILPILAFVMAITLAFAIPVEKEPISGIETSDFQVTVHTDDLPGCPTCNLIGPDDCTGGEVTCECRINDSTFQAYNDDCSMLLKRQ